MSNANIQVYLNKGVPHINLLKLVEYIHEVWEAHAQEKVADLEPPPTPKAGDASKQSPGLPGFKVPTLPTLPSGDRFSNEGEDAHTNDRGSIMTLKERQEASRPTPMLSNSSKVLRDKYKAELRKALEAENRADLLDVLWNMGIRKPRELADLEWEDVSEEGISKIQFKALQHTGRKPAPSSDAAGDPTTGDIELQLAQKQAADADQTTQI